MEDGIIATTTTDMVVDPQIAITITEATCTPVEITTVIVLDMAAKIMVIMGEAYSTITTHLEARGQSTLVSGFCHTGISFWL